MKTFWWTYDEHGIMNFSDTHEAFRYARQHVDGLMEGDTWRCDSFQAEAVADCWDIEHLHQWENGVFVGKREY